MAYHGDLEKKAAMEKQRGAAETSDNFKGGFSKQFFLRNILVLIQILDFNINANSFLLLTHFVFMLKNDVIINFMFLFIFAHFCFETQICLMYFIN